ncbi:MAG TPA: glycosyltransferase family 87 protein [Terriglobales bacterium]|nr:glycosyltransferase family 87 protein [Terriglobales bacterium]
MASANKRALSLLGLFLLGMALCNGVLFFGARHVIASGSTDFMHLYVSGKLVRTGQGAKLYDGPTQLAAQLPVSAWVRFSNSPYVYLRPAFEAFLFVPFSYLPLRAAFILWDGINIVILLCIPWILRAELPSFTRLPYIYWAVILFAFFPVTSVLIQGQDDILLLLLLALAYLAIAREKMFAAGCWLGLSAFRPQFVLPLLFILLFAGDSSVLWGFLTVTLLFAALTAILIGWSVLIEYPKYLWWFANVGHNHHSGDQVFGNAPNIRGLWSGYLSTYLSENAITVGLVLLSMVTVGIAAVMMKKWGRTRPELSFSIALIAAILVSYHAFAHDLVLLLLPLFLQLEWTTVHNPSARMMLGLWSAPAILFITPVCYLLVRHAAFNLYSVALLVWVVSASLAVGMEKAAQGARKSGATV